MTKHPKIDPEQERLATIQAAKAFVGHDEPINAEEAMIVEEARRELPRANRKALTEQARSLAKRK